MDEVVGPETYFYSAATNVREFSLEYTDRGCLNIQSTLMTHWINYSALCLGMLVHPVITERLRGTCFPKEMTIHTYCLNRLRTMWDEDFLLVLNINQNQRDYLVQNYILNFYKVKLMYDIVIMPYICHMQ